MHAVGNQPVGNRAGNISIRLSCRTLVFVETEQEETEQEADSLQYLYIYSEGFPATAIHCDITQRVNMFRVSRSEKVTLVLMDKPILEHLDMYDMFAKAYEELAI